jgi:glycerophosphoryl diester phosphodiesterase
MQVWTHRGNPGVENSLAAFTQAWNDGIRFFETDIHSTIDGVLVLAHDTDIYRLSGIHKKISEITWRELSGYRINDKEPWTTLDQLCRKFPDAFISIDVKDSVALIPFLHWLHGQRMQNLVVGSFSPARIKVVRKEFPQITTALTTYETLLISLGLGVLVDQRGGPRMAMVPEKFKGIRILNKNLESYCLRRQIPLIIWAVNELDDLERIQEFQISGIVTDRYPDFI